MELIKKPTISAEELASAQESIEQARNNALKGFFAKMRHVPGRPPLVLADYQLARKEAGEAFALSARILNEKGFAIERVDEDAVFKAIDQWFADQQREREHGMPLHKVADLSVHGLLPVGKTLGGTLWICANLAVLVNENGMCAVYVRGAEETDPDWAADWMPDTTRMPVLRGMDYPLQGLLQFTNGQGYARMAPLNEEQMNACRTPRKPMELTEGSTSNTVANIALIVSLAAITLAAIALFAH